MGSLQAQLQGTYKSKDLHVLYDSIVADEKKIRIVAKDNDELNSRNFCFLFSSSFSDILRFRASSVLQRNLKVYGPKHALDYDNPSTCWNSDGTLAGEGGGNSNNKSPKTTSFIIDFGRVVQPHELRIQFQAGFAAEQIHVYQQGVGEDGGNNEWQSILELEAEDDHELQTFPLESSSTCESLKLDFEEFTDFYGRVTIYQLQVWGYEQHKENK